MTIGREISKADKSIQRWQLTIATLWNWDQEFLLLVHYCAIWSNTFLSMTLAKQGIGTNMQHFGFKRNSQMRSWDKYCPLSLSLLDAWKITSSSNWRQILPSSIAPNIKEEWAEEWLLGDACMRIKSSFPTPPLWRIFVMGRWKISGSAATKSPSMTAPKQIILRTLTPRFKRSLRKMVAEMTAPDTKMAWRGFGVLEGSIAKEMRIMVTSLLNARSNKDLNDANLGKK